MVLISFLSKVLIPSCPLLTPHLCKCNTDITAGSVIPDYEHEYDQPFVEPATEEDELVCQITDLDVPCISASDIE